jgi:hypothetical protein
MDNYFLTGVEDDVFNATRPAEIEKSLSVGYEHASTDQTGWGATRYESLEDTLKMLTPDLTFARFWNSIPKETARNTVIEYALLEEVGDAVNYSEGGLPEEFDESITRKLVNTRFTGAIGTVSNVAQLTNTVVSAYETSIMMKTIAITRKLDLLSIHGDNSKMPLDQDGIIAQCEANFRYPDQNIINLKGGPITLETLNDIGSIIVEAGNGTPDNIQLWGSPGHFNYYSQHAVQQKQLFMLGSGFDNYKVAPKVWNLGIGSGEFQYDRYFYMKDQTYKDRLHPKLNAAGSAFLATHASAPATLASGTASAVTAALAGSELPVAHYDYAVIAVNQYGASAAYEIEDVNVSSNEKVVFTLTAATGVTKFEIYRKLHSDTDKKSYRYLTSFKSSGVAIEDTGYWIPGTSTAIAFNKDLKQVFSIKQYGPMFKRDLPITGDQYRRWLQAIYWTPVVYNPNRVVILRNVGGRAEAVAEANAA